MISASDFACSAAFQQAPVAYSLLDLEGRQVADNQAFRDLFRTGEGPIEVEDITHADDLDRTSAYFSGLCDGSRERIVVDKRYVRADGTVFWGRLTATAPRDETGTTSYFVGVIEDLTEQMSSLAQMQGASAAKSQIVARVSRYLRTPLHAIHGLAELPGYADLDDEHRAFAEAIQHGADSLRLLVDDLLDLSRLEAGRMELRNEPFDLAACLEDVAALVGHRARSKDIVLELDVIGLSESNVQGDAGRIRQILTNLADNAVKFTDEGSLTMRVTSEVGTVKFEVCDTGNGIAPSDLKLIFEPFGRAHHDTPGTGLDLNITSDLVEMMGGSLAVESTPGKGRSSLSCCPSKRTTDLLVPKRRRLSA